MSSVISIKTLKFLKDLKSHNHKEWFLDNKSRYEEAKGEFEHFIDELIGKIAKFDKSISDVQAKNCVFRIYRDIRFSKDKSPYKTNFGAHISSTPVKTDAHSKAGYYLHLEPGASMLAGGAWLPAAPWLNAIRSEIDYNPREFKKIINASPFKKYFGTIEGEKLVNPPKGYAADHPEISYLKQKSFLAVHKPADQTVTSDTFAGEAAKIYQAYYPFCKFLNRAQE
jgi:uncharacterized protein (TIGR02453 family)